MGRPANIIPSSKLNTAIPVDLRARLDMYLYSELEGRVPKDAYRHFLERLLREFFEGEALDLSPYLGTLPGESLVRGSPSTITKLKEKLSGSESGITK